MRTKPYSVYFVNNIKHISIRHTIWAPSESHAREKAKAMLGRLRTIRESMVEYTVEYIKEED